jgi:lactaldehyde reductase
MALGQYIAGMGFSNVGLGLVHAMAYPLRAFYDAPHPRGQHDPAAPRDAVQYRVHGDEFGEIARTMGVDGIDPMTIEQARLEAIRAGGAFAADLGALGSRREIGASKDDIPAAAAMAEVYEGRNPREATLDDVIAPYTAAFKPPAEVRGRSVARSDRPTRPDFSSR